MEIKIASLKDFQELFELYKALYDIDQSFDHLKEKKEVEILLKKYFRKFFEKENYFVILAKEKEILGFVSICLKYYPRVYQERKFAYLDSIFVKEKARKKQIGKKLILKAQEILKEKGIRFLELEVYEKNKGAKKFFQKLGFKTLSQKMRKKI